MKRIIHVAQQAIKANTRHPEREPLPPIIVRSYKGAERAFTARTTGPIEFKYRPHEPLSCGARLWAETEHEVVLDEGTPKERTV